MPLKLNVGLTGRSAKRTTARQHLDLAGELRRRYGVERPDDLSITEVS